MQPDMVEGLFDGFIKKFIDDLIKSASFDVKKLLTHPKFKEGVSCLAIAAKDSATLPFNLDDKIIDQAVLLLDTIIEQYKNSGPVMVGTAPVEAKRKHSREEVEAMLRSVGIDPITVASLIIMLLQYAPALLDAIKKLFGK